MQRLRRWSYTGLVGQATGLGTESGRLLAIEHATVHRGPASLIVAIPRHEWELESSLFRSNIAYDIVLIAVCSRRAAEIPSNRCRLRAFGVANEL